MESSDFSVEYWEYLKTVDTSLDSSSLPHIAATLRSTDWEDPSSALDLNNFAVMAWIQADNSPDDSMRNLYIEMAFEALNNGVELHEDPLCAAHLVFLLMKYGDIQQAMDMTFCFFYNSVESAYVLLKEAAPGIVYLPLESVESLKDEKKKVFLESLQAHEGYSQALLLLNYAMECLKTKSVGRSEIEITQTVRKLRILELAVNIFTNFLHLCLTLTLPQKISNQWIADIYFYWIQQNIENHPYLIQSLCLTFRDIHEIELEKKWINWSKIYCTTPLKSWGWKWVELEVESPFTYVPFEGDFLLAVEPTCRSMVTSILISQGDWFENEIEFWRSQIQPGMTIIDVGANVGVYAFSAARQVGAEGRVLAIEPFPGCLLCLEETCRVNQFSWVTVCDGAASDIDGTVKLSLNSASELNQIISNDSGTEKNSDDFVEVPCFCLDSLIVREHLSRVDFLKIDAEGHEMQVLAGSSRLLTEFSPTIIYENSNPDVGRFLQSRGYKLFIYQPYVQNLVPIESAEDWQGTLNLIAVPQSKV